MFLLLRGRSREPFQFRLLRGEVPHTGEVLAEPPDLGLEVACPLPPLRGLRLLLRGNPREFGLPLGEGVSGGLQGIADRFEFPIALAELAVLGLADLPGLGQRGFGLGLTLGSVRVEGVDPSFEIHFGALQALLPLPELLVLGGDLPLPRRDRAVSLRALVVPALEGLRPCFKVLPR